MRRLSESLAFEKTVNQLNIKNPDALRVARLLIHETSKRQNFIDKFISNALKARRLEEYDLGVQAFLRLYVYQTRISNSWTKTDLREAESIASLGRSILGWQALHKVEDILGSLLAQEQTIVLEGVDDEQTVALETFHPTWFVKYCFRVFGRLQSIAMLQGDSRPPITYMRLNTLKEEENHILNRLEQEGIKVEKEQELKYTYRLKSTRLPLATTEGFRNGLFYIQDKASCFAVEAADPKPGMTVVDVCAAPGAKTTHLAQLMHDQGRIYSVDYSQRRMIAWKKEVARMNTTIAVPIIADARKQFPIAIEADILVLDPPCTSTGTFRKLPSSKWRLTPRSTQTMAAIQWQMINNCAQYVRVGGSLIYSTCSITIEENEIIIERFLKHHAEFSLTSISPKIGLLGLRELEDCQRLYSHIHESNGFFIAKLKKTEN